MRTIYFGKPYWGGVGERIGADEILTPYPFEFNLLVARIDGTDNPLGAKYAQAEPVRVAVKDDEAANILSATLNDGDPLFIRTVIDTSFAKPVIVIESQADIVLNSTGEVNT